MVDNTTCNKSSGFRQDNYGKKALIQKLIPSAFVNIFFAFTIFFFSPLEIFLGNTNEFIFSLGEVWWILFLYSLLIAAVLTLIALALPKKPALFVNIGIFALGLCGYIQSMFLNGNMSSLTGEGDSYSYATVYINLGVWIVLFIGLLVVTAFLLKFGKAETYKKAVCFIAVAITAMQLTAFGVSSLSVSSPAQYFYLSNKGQYELSSGKNTVIFVVDTCDGGYIDQMMSENPEAVEGFDGFIYYPDALSTHSRTYPSLPYMLTGEICYFDKPYDTYINEAHANSSYISDIYNTGCNIGLYTDDQYIGMSNTQYIANVSDYDSNARISPVGVSLWMSRMSLYRNLPYLFKSPFTYTDQQINRNSVIMPDACNASEDKKLYDGMMASGLSVTDEYGKALRLYHLWGAHAGADIDRNLNKVSASGSYEAVLGDFKLISEYINKMKEAGIYDDSTIIVTADHGISYGTSNSKPLEIDGPVRSLMMVKPAGTHGKTGMTTSDAEVCHADLFATVIDSFGGNTDNYGKTIFEYGEDEERTRLYYHTMMYSDIDGEVALREYAVTGDSRDFDNWKLTGNYWDVNYSERAVSKHRLSEVLK